jgi:hypothetical protein
MPSVLPASSNPAKRLLAFLDGLVDVGRLGRQAGDEAQRRREVARGEQHAGDDQLLDRVGVRAGRVEDRDAATAQRGDRDVVGAGAGPADRLHARRDLDAVQVGRPHQDRIGLSTSLPTV